MRSRHMHVTVTHVCSLQRQEPSSTFLFWGYRAPFDELASGGSWKLRNHEGRWYHGDRLPFAITYIHNINKTNISKQLLRLICSRPKYYINIQSNTKYEFPIYYSNICWIPWLVEIALLWQNCSIIYCMQFSQINLFMRTQNCTLLNINQEFHYHQQAVDSIRHFREQSDRCSKYNQR